MLYTDKHNQKVVGAKFWITGLAEDTLKMFIKRTPWGDIKDCDYSLFDICATVDENARRDTERVMVYISYREGTQAPHNVFLDATEQTLIRNAFFAQLSELKNSDEKIIQCKHCGNYFSAPNRKYRYCESCHESSVYRKIRYTARSTDEKQRIARNIESLLFKNPNAALKAEFRRKSRYFKAKLKGKPVEIDNQLELIPMNNENDYIKWLCEFHIKVKEEIKQR